MNQLRSELFIDENAFHFRKLVWLEENSEMDPTFSYAIRTSDCKSHMPPVGPGITLRQEYEYLVNSIIRLMYGLES